MVLSNVVSMWLSSLDFLCFGKVRVPSPALQGDVPILSFQGWRVEGLPLSSGGFGAFSS